MKINNLCFISKKYKKITQKSKKSCIFAKKLYVLVMEQVIIGTEIKFAVAIEADGFSMESDDFTLSIMKGRNVVKEYAKSDLIEEDDETFLLCIDTTEIGVGNFDLAINAYVPDTHFPDGYRTEVYRVSLMTVKKL